ncbi:MAG TPA: L,D-transpeptidase family protein [Stellaceae bacterium]|nr:L,D-transpeptidase family protein [Stellaceae bacterium]
MSSRVGVALCAAALAIATTPAAAAQFTLTAGARAVGAVETYVAAASDNLLDLARRYDLGYTQLIAANPGIDPWRPGTGRAIRIPSYYLLPDEPRRGIIVNLAEQRLFYFPPGGHRVETFPIGTAVHGLDSPLGTTRVVAKLPHPTWYPPASIRAERPDLPAAIPPGPDDPLGAYALALAWPGYLIHGTNKPDGIGRNVSHGCVHLYPEDILRLYREVPVGTPVRVIDEAAEVEWVGDTLFLAVHPSKAEADQLDSGERMTPSPPPRLRARVAAIAAERGGQVDWAAVERAGRERNGIPVPVSSTSTMASGASSP